jgi:hypothetical protein
MAAGEFPRRNPDIKRFSDDPKRDLEKRIAVALHHPLRAEILAIMNLRASSADDVWRERFEELHPLSTVSYHVRVLWSLGCLELVREERRRGSIKKVYKGITRMLINTLEWSLLSAESKSQLTNFSIGVLNEQMKEAIAAGTFDGRETRHLSTTTVDVDEQGWSEVADLLGGVLSRIIEIGEESANREADAERRFPATIGIISFESPQSMP